MSQNEKSAGRVTGIGGIFFRSPDIPRMKAWYEKHLGLVHEDESAVIFRWRDHANPEKIGSTVWSIFPKDTKYFGTSGQTFMMNYRVDDLRKVLEELRAEGVKVDERVEESEYGHFGWIEDPDGNRIELWQPPAE